MGPASFVGPLNQTGRPPCFDWVRFAIEPRPHGLDFRHRGRLDRGPSLSPSIVPANSLPCSD
jgi:hypothetical protein